VTLAFLSPTSSNPEVLAESPFAHATADAGAIFETRDGWRVATRIGDARHETLARAETVGWADVSHLGKLELQVGGPDAGDLASLAGGLTLGSAVRHRNAWWCLVTPVRALVICESADTRALHDELATRESLTVLDVTAQFAALRIGGPEARETFARFCSLDLRSGRAPVGAFLPGSIARTPGFVLREDDDQYLTLTGAAYAMYYWTVVSDAGHRLGGRPVGADCLTAPAAGEEASTYA
jgi:heterotetrameric sarcosine oxidase gamma subunit